LELSCSLSVRILCSTFKLAYGSVAPVIVETLGEALNHGWRVHMRCLDDGMEGLKRKRECGLRMTLDLATLVATRGRSFPVALLSERLRCPSCGCRRVTVMFEPDAGDTRSLAAMGRPKTGTRYR
jgi:hypothetical protein